MRTGSLTPARCCVAARLPTGGGRCPRADANIRWGALLGLRTLEPRPERTGGRQLGSGGGQLGTSRGVAANVGLRVWTGRRSSLSSTSRSRTAGTGPCLRPARRWRPTAVMA